MIKVIFVCLGNICRSPSGEAVMNKLIKERKLQEKISCDSAGTSAYHIGERADYRMRKHAAKRGIDLTSIARQFDYSDFEKFDYIIAMDRSNLRDILNKDKNGKYKGKVFLMTDFSGKFDYDGVPDPYYGGDAGFELVLDILEDACSNLLEKIIVDHNLE